MRALSSSLRKQLVSAIIAARRAAESASRAAIDGLGVFAERRPEHLTPDQAPLRNGLRAKWRQLGGDQGARELLVSECAYEQWHRLLFARFLAENKLLLHPEYKAPVTLADCEELAGELGEPDGWAVAARFASEILPGIFRLDDPAVQLRLAPEGRHVLEQILDSLPEEIFAADDALGWVYQFWQKDKRDEVNASERKIGGADLGPVTQLFTENYMVRFLLENSLGAWWAARYPESPLVKGFGYLRLDDDGQPAAGSFDGWPDRVADVTVMDPCCGSGHFLVEAFSMLWQMRAEEEDLSPVDAQDAVLRDNLFGLELDARCVQIAMFAVALKVWKAGGGYRQLPMPNIACSGIPIKASLANWKSLARVDERLGSALERLHFLFKNADTLGSLIDPPRVADLEREVGSQASFDDVDWGAVAPLLLTVADAERVDPATAVLGLSASALARAADLASRQYTLVVTNVPYLTSVNQDDLLKSHLNEWYRVGKADLATAFVLRSLNLGTSLALVTPHNWTFMTGYTTFRTQILQGTRISCLAFLGPHAFSEISGEIVKALLLIATQGTPEDESRFLGMDAGDAAHAIAKAEALSVGPLSLFSQLDQLTNPDSRIVLSSISDFPRLERYADVYKGITTGDDLRYQRRFWELQHVGLPWLFQQSTVRATAFFEGRSKVVFAGENGSLLAKAPGAYVRGVSAWGRKGVAATLGGSIPVTLYTGELSDTNCGLMVPKDRALLPALWTFCSSPQFGEEVRRLDRHLVVKDGTLVKVPFDIDYWQKVAAALYPDGLPTPFSNDPTQWLFKGSLEASRAPLQVAVALLLGYHWPEQTETDDLDAIADADGVVCLPSVAGEAPAAESVQQVLATVFGEAWSPGKVKELLEQAGSSKKTLMDWLRDEFFKQHCALFGNRPFVWHIWDGQRDGFSSLVNYHRLDRKMLEKLTYTYLGQDWMERQRAEVRDEVPGAEARLSAGVGLQRKLELILEGEAPYDIYVRWKALHEQPTGWEPDLNDGVRLNIRPFIEAGVLRTKSNIHWKKDRGKNPDGSERHNDIHLTLAEKQAARKAAGRS